MTTPIEPRWYCVSVYQTALLCKDEEDARSSATLCDQSWPAGSPHRAVLLGDVAAERETIQRLREALTGLLERYTDLVNFGDWGTWNPEREDQVIPARAALALLDGKAHG
jgi:hypothetical protein